MIRRILRAYTRRYSDTGQWSAYVEWEDHKRQQGRTEGPAYRRKTPKGEHMTALFNRAKREGVKIEHESW